MKMQKKPVESKRLKFDFLSSLAEKPLIFSAFFLGIFLFPGFAPRLWALDATIPGEVTTPYPTITNLAVEWMIAGDDNLNGVVTVEYRIAGQQRWHPAMPLRRIPAGRSRRTRPIYHWKNRHSGSIFDLKPDTEYEIRLKLHDPDGGKAEKVVRARTRAVPRPAPDAVVKRVTPVTFRDSARTAQPGDILLLMPGYYGHFVMERDGRPGRPIVIRSDRSHPSINSTFDSISLRGRKHVILDGLTVIHGSVDLLGAEEVAVRHCKVVSKFGIIANKAPGCKNCYVADNDVSYIMPWSSPGLGASFAYGGAACVGEGIQLAGPGNVICHNRVKGYRDCISLMEEQAAYNQICTDIYNNDIYVGADDAIEADFAQGNCRIMRNRITNCFMGLSSQPGLGGPTYFIRNVMYNIINCPFKLSRGSRGDVILHNTVVKVGAGFMVVHNPSLALFRNNLLIGGPGAGMFGKYGSGPAVAVFFPRYNSTCDMDYDGVGTHGLPFKAEVGGRVFENFEEFRKGTTEKHSVLVDMSVFENNVAFPDPPMPERKPPELSLKPGSAAVDAGVLIPNLNDDYTGRAPDLGAYELGRDLPHYGPRPLGVDEETEWLKKSGGR